MSEPEESVAASFWGNIDDVEAVGRFETLVNAVEDGIYQLDAEGRFVGVNDKIVETTGYGREELLGAHASLVLDDDDIERIKRDIRERVTTGDGFDDSTSHEITIETADGEVLFGDLQISLLVSDGEFRGSIGIVRDVSEQIRREHHLESELEEIFGRISDAFYAVDTDWRITHANERMEELVGRTEEELIGENVWNLFPEAVDTKIYEMDHRAMETGEPLSYEAYFEPLDLWFEAHLYPSETGMSVYFQDISDRKEREEELERYETVVETIWDGVTVLDADEQFVMVNDAYCEMTGYDREEIIGEHATYVHDEAVHEEAKTLHEEVIAGDRDVATLEYDLRRADGETIPVEARFGPYETKDGQVGGVGVIRDVTERKQHERELELFRTLLDHSNDSVLVVDPETSSYLDVNDTACERRGYSREEFLDLAVTDLETEIPDQEAWRSFVEELRAEGQLTFDGHHRRKDGTTYPVEVNASYVDLNQEYVLAIARDVTERREYEQYLEDAKSRLEAATEAGAVGTWEWQIPEDEMVVGTTFARTFGIDPEVAPEGVSLDQFIEAIHEDDRERVEAAIEEAVETCGDYEEEYRVWNADGNLRWVVARGHVECDDGEPIRFPGALTDITERKRAEVELRQNNDQLETLFEVLPVGVVVAEANGQIVQANDIAHEIWGGDIFDAESVEEYEQYPVWDAESGERVQSDEMTLARVVDGEEVLDPDIYEIEKVDGERRVIRAEGMPVRDEHGEVTRGVVTLTDITDRREAQRALEESERRYRTLVENFPNGAVGLFDEDLRYTAVGGQLFDRLDYDPEDRIGHRFTEVHAPDLVEELEPHFRAALDGEAGSFETEYRGRHLHAHTLPVRDANGEVYAGMLVIQDMTERREYEHKLEESNERLEQFAYAASHDLQEPLRMVSSYLQLLERRYDDDLDEDAREFLEFAVDGANRMREMIDGLLEYSRVETRGDPFEPVDLTDVLAEVCDDLQVRIQESNAEITAEDLPRVEGDRGQLRQVFQNLLDNAIEYSGDDPPRISIDAERDGDRWLMSVEDNGVGIDPKDTDRVFEVFQRLHARDEHTGTGIGLALVERIVERHGGDVWVESNPGEGSTFSFTLPVVSDFET